MPYRYSIIFFLAKANAQLVSEVAEKSPRRQQQGSG
jgi:hypothetical protein